MLSHFILLWISASASLCHQLTCKCPVGMLAPALGGLGEVLNRGSGFRVVGFKPRLCQRFILPLGQMCHVTPAPFPKSGDRGVSSQLQALQRQPLPRAHNPLLSGQPVAVCANTDIIITILNRGGGMKGSGQFLNPAGQVVDG